jgi:hypothetical protein
VNQFATLYSFVRNGVGLTIVPDLARPPAHDSELVSRPLVRPRVSREIGIRKSIYTKTGILLDINLQLAELCLWAQFTGAIDERRRHSMFASLSAMIAVAAPNIRLPSYENRNRGSSGVTLWKAKNRVR